MKLKALKISLALAISLLMIFGVASAAWAQEAADAATPLGRFLESLKNQGNKDSSGNEITGGKKQFFLTIANKVDQFADGDNADTKYEYTLIFNKGKDSEINEKLSLKNKGAKVYKLEEGTTYEIASLASGRYAVVFDGGAQGVMNANRTITAISKASATYSLTITNECLKGGPGNSVNIRITFDNGARYETITVNAGESKAIKNIPPNTHYTCETTASGVIFASGSGSLGNNATVVIKEGPQQGSNQLQDGSGQQTTQQGPSQPSSQQGSNQPSSQQGSNQPSSQQSSQEEPHETLGVTDIATSAPLTTPGVTSPGVNQHNTTSQIVNQPPQNGSTVTLGGDDDDENRGDIQGIGSTKTGGQNTGDDDGDNGPSTGDVASYAFWALAACVSLVGIAHFKKKAALN